VNDLVIKYNVWIMNSLVIPAFLTVSPIKMGIFAVLDYIAYLSDSKTYSNIVQITSIVVSLMYVAMYYYIWTVLDSKGIDAGFEYNRTTKIVVILVAIGLIFAIVISQLIIDHEGKIHDKMLGSFEILLYLVISMYLLFRVNSSVKKVSKGYNMSVVKKEDISWYIVIPLVIITYKIFRLYVSNYNQDLVPT
jgi:hypothetical protein